MILDSDAHEPQDLMTREYAEKVAIGSGLSPEQAVSLLDRSPIVLLENLKTQRY